jgi:CheY-like chemotaxis protein
VQPRGSLDLIRRKPDDTAKVRRWAETGYAAAERGAKLTAQLLAFSRAQKMELKPVVVAEIVERMRDLLTGTLGGTVQVSFDLDDARTPVLADPTQLELAVLNLAINARDAMPDGGRLTVSTRPIRLEDDAELPPGDYVVVAVTDTGVGMPEDVRARAFDPFFTTKGVGKGTGLGLAQVYGIARQAGGAARIESRPGEGTTVCLILPRVDGVAARPEPGVEPPSPAPGVGQRILVVDDDAGVRLYVRDALETAGYRVDTAEDGAAALKALARRRPDLLILDYAMPGMTGAEVARTVRADRPDLPILFASGYAETAALEDAVGPCRMLRKPFDTDELTGAVRDALVRPAPGA